MTSDRPYRRALSGEAARAEVLAGLGSQFCPTAGRALLETLAE
jgi:HD-GYP domain-containing protein (c-di-GMP phosphodiesterase class II)